MRYNIISLYRNNLYSVLSDQVTFLRVPSLSVYFCMQILKYTRTILQTATNNNNSNNLLQSLACSLMHVSFEIPNDNTVRIGGKRRD